MKLIVGLGNPGKEYQFTRHNAGWIAIDILLDKHGYTSSKKELKSEIFTTIINGEKTLLAKPQTFMNLSGQAVQQIINFYKINIQDIVILHDEKDFVIGDTRVKLDGSSAGHNGIKSIIEQLGTTKFKRIRIGVGLVEPNWKIVDWVLSKFKEEELLNLQTTLKANLDSLL